MAYTNHVLYTWQEFKALLRGEPITGTPYEEPNFRCWRAKRGLYVAIWSSEESNAELAEQHGLSVQVISDVRKRRPVWW